MSYFEIVYRVLVPFSSSRVVVIFSCGSLWSIVGREMTHTILGGRAKSSARWDGNALVIETKVMNGNYTIHDRWALSGDHESLRIERELSNAPGRPRRVVLERQ